MLEDNFIIWIVLQVVTKIRYEGALWSGNKWGISPCLREYHCQTSKEAPEHGLVSCGATGEPIYNVNLFPPFSWNRIKCEISFPLSLQLPFRPFLRQKPMERCKGNLVFVIKSKISRNLIYYFHLFPVFTLLPKRQTPPPVRRETRTVRGISLLIFILPSNTIQKPYFIHPQT